MQRRLSVTAAFVHAGGSVRNEASQQVGTVQVRRRAGVNHGAGRDQTFCRRSRRRIERVEPAGPPVAAPVGVGAAVEQRVHHREVVRVRHDRRRVEGKHRTIDPMPQLGMFLKQTAQHAGVMPAEGVAQERLGRVLLTLLHRWVTAIVVEP